jgi:hypothetical protein
MTRGKPSGSGGFFSLRNCLGAAVASKQSAKAKMNNTGRYGLAEKGGVFIGCEIGVKAASDSLGWRLRVGFYATGEAVANTNLKMSLLCSVFVLSSQNWK